MYELFDVREIGTILVYTRSESSEQFVLLRLGKRCFENYPPGVRFARGSETSKT